MNAPSSRAASFAGVPYAEVLSRARALVPTLRERAGRAEEARRLLPETESELHRIGLLRYVQPKRYGGMEHDFISIYQVPYELARGCASTGWNAGNLAVHHWMLALYDERAQADVWDANPDAKIASGIAYPQGRGRKVDGGFIVSGNWNFSSAVDGAQWNMLAAIIRDGEKVIDHRMCLVPSSDYEVIDDWQVLGMRGTGSKSVRANEIFVPEYRALCMYLARGDSSFPGAKANPNPVFRVPLSALGSHCIAGVAVGNAQAAVELTCESVKERSTNYTGMKMRDFQAVQLRVGLAAAKVDGAHVILKNDCFDAQRIAEENRMPTVEEKLRFKRNVAWAVQLCTEAVDSLHAMAGANGIYDRYPIQRMFRDAHALMGHFGFSVDAQVPPWGLVALGGAVESPTL